MRLRAVYEEILDLLFPRRCVWCGSILPYKKTTCDCEPQVRKLRLENPVVSRPPKYIDKIYAAFSYEDLVRAALLRLKNQRDDQFLQDASYILLDLMQAYSLVVHFDVLVPVPMTERDLQKRGYNQSSLLAQRLGKIARMPWDLQALYKIRQTLPQKDLDRKNRITNVKGAYQLGPSSVRGKSVLLIDDVVTTGSTLRECARVLQKGGAKKVTAICIAATLDTPILNTAVSPRPQWSPPGF